MVAWRLYTPNANLTQTTKHNTAAKNQRSQNKFALDSYNGQPVVKQIKNATKTSAKCGSRI